MILRVDVDNVGAMVELDNEPWTPEVLETLLRICSDEVIRTVIALSQGGPEAAEEGEQGVAE